MTSAIAIGENLVLERDLGFLFSTTFTYISLAITFGNTRFWCAEYPRNKLGKCYVSSLAIIQEGGRGRIYVKVTFTIAHKVGKNCPTMSQVLCDLQLII